MQSQLHFEIYGESKGVATLFFHGWPGSSLEAKLISREAKKHGIRLIAIDRFASYTLESHYYTSWAEEIKALLQELRLDRVDLLAVSGGAPHAYALLALAPEMIGRATIVCGMIEIDGIEQKSSLFNLGRLYCAKAPWMIKTNLALMQLSFRYFPHIALKMLIIFSNISDKRVLKRKDIQTFIIHNMNNALADGKKMLLEELCAMLHRWDFDTHTIQTPIKMWHGTEDRVIPLPLVQQYIQDKSNITLYPLEHEGHYSIAIENIDRILQTHLA